MKKENSPAITYGLILGYLATYLEKKKLKRWILSKALGNVDPSALSRTINGQASFTSTQNKIPVNASKRVDNLLKDEDLNSICDKDLITDLNAYLEVLEKQENKKLRTEKVKDTYFAYDKEPTLENRREFFLALFNEADNNIDNLYAPFAKHSGQDISKGNKVNQISFPVFVYPGSSDYIERKNFLHEIDDRLKIEGLVVIYGIDGLGKYQNALHYAAKWASNAPDLQNPQSYSDKQESCRVQQILFTKDLQTTINNIRFIPSLDKEEDSPEEHCKRRLKTLSQFSSEFLLLIHHVDADVIDSVEARKILRRLQNMEMKVIITTQNLSHQRKKAWLSIPPLSDDEAIEIFKQYNRRNDLSSDKLTTDEISQLKNLFRIIDHHTLLIEIIAKMLHSIGSLTLTDLRQALLSIKTEKAYESCIEKSEKEKYEMLYQFIDKLLELSSITETEKSILNDLAIHSFSTKGIRKGLFAEISGNSGITSSIDRLIDLGWIEESKEHVADIESRIHLHSVIRAALQRNLDWTPVDYEAYLKKMNATLWNAFCSRGLQREKPLYFFSDIDDLCSLAIDDLANDQIPLSYYAAKGHLYETVGNILTNYLDPQNCSVRIITQLVSDRYQAFRHSVKYYKKGNADSELLAKALLDCGNAYIKAYCYNDAFHNKSTDIIISKIIEFFDEGLSLLEHIDPNGLTLEGKRLLLTYAYINYFNRGLLKCNIDKYDDGMKDFEISFNKYESFLVSFGTNVDFESNLLKTIDGIPEKSGNHQNLEKLRGKIHQWQKEGNAQS